MDNATLVSFDIDNGQRVLDALQSDGKEVDVALWAVLPDYGDWRLIVASGCLDQTSTRAGYGEILAALKKAGIPVHRQPTVFMRPMDHPMIQDLRRAYSHVTDSYGMRLGGQKFGDKYFEDAFVYRIR